ncbi:hypothetical protein L226DRAFT_540777 [Lentinus tigrinus ALCF2SS1-7]|uniref:Aminoglycoside phosphotransferase domain-containing protein n=1 Tax=Lentinus tigrinus ALCF2SS1-6 TaxID=1328759 RepID=A0A5C2RQT9_9APHY|nr:hypothetical protein L227DRAFT_536251 [Lentinus tigrinus ALCF2SS1-6]RPD68314.1 hypothetical protein L226DRAFT_540777 [Lentinus tigrinus ALCF2SS1-7]
MKPKFPPSVAEQPTLPCPPLGRKSSPLSRKLRFYVHEWLLIPLSEWYTYLRGIPQQPAIYYLPFGYILKSAPRLREEEGLAMNLARAMGVPAPRFISFGEPPPSYIAKHPLATPSLLMTQVPGIELSLLNDDEVDFEVVRSDLLSILASMRRFASPWGDAVCGMDGGHLYGPLVPGSPLPPCANESAFYDTLRIIGNLPNVPQGAEACLETAERFFALPRHAIVFTHGDLLRHNIMVGEDGHISGIIDWESAAWLPEYWEISVTTVFKGYRWGQFMDKKVASDAYAAEVEGHRAMFSLLGDSLSIL